MWLDHVGLEEVFPINSDLSSEAKMRYTDLTFALAGKEQVHRSVWQQLDLGTSHTWYRFPPGKHNLSLYSHGLLRMTKYFRNQVIK